MIWVKRVLILLVVTLIGLFTLHWAASETTGEVVVISTTDSAGTSHETRLWVVDNDGYAWLRAGTASATWYQRLTANSTLSMTRHDETRGYTAVPLPAEIGTINGLFSAKYNWGEKLIGKMFSRSEAIAVRLDPQER